MPEITLARGAIRALRRRCPRCGGGAIFRRWLRMAESCPTCGLRFERTEGYWTGSMALNLVVTEVVFVAVLVGTILGTSPDPNWGLVLGLALASNVLVPVAFFPASRLLWVTIERRMHGTASSEIGGRNG